MSRTTYIFSALTKPEAIQFYYHGGGGRGGGGGGYSEKRLWIKLTLSEREQQKCENLMVPQGLMASIVAQHCSVHLFNVDT